MKKSESYEGITNLVSVITPSYNSEEFIEATINSVLNQTYSNLEMIIVDDHSNDKTTDIIKDYQKNDERIKLIVLESNSGAAIARNTAVEYARGQYMAFLDSDDVWDHDKLCKQISFMKENNFSFTSTSFEEIDADNKLSGNIIKSHERLDYDGLLKYNPGNSTIIYDARKLGKYFIPDIRKRNDFVMWLKVIKDAKYVYGMEEPLTKYRVREDSLSTDKKSLIKYQWQVYRDIEKLSIQKSIYLLVHKIISVIFKNKRMGVSKND